MVLDLYNHIVYMVPAVI